MRPIYLFVLSTFALFTACNSSYSSSSSSSNKDQAKEQQMLADGFMKATVMLYNQESGCPVVLILEDGEKLDPINLDPSMAKENLELWIKFSRLRRMPRCEYAGIVSLTEAQKKAE
ncbi:MAG: hypothetical protein ABJM06_12165 [Gilvibacter sp.]